MLMGLPWCRSWAEPLPGDPAASVREQPEAGVAADPRECLLLGQRYENGIGVPQDLDRALVRYCEAAHLWLADARYHLGWLYVSGRLGKIDEVLAAPWFKSALALGHPRASQQLQRLEATNLDLEADPACVLRDAMVAHRIIDLRPPAAPSRPAESDPKSDSPHPPRSAPPTSSPWSSAWRPTTAWTPIWSWPSSRPNPILPLMPSPPRTPRG